MLFLFFYGNLNLLGYDFEFSHMRLSALGRLIFGVHGVQEMFFRRAKKEKKNSVDSKPPRVDNILFPK